MMLKALALLLIAPLAWSSGNGNNHNSDSGATSTSGSGSSANSYVVSSPAINNWLYVAPSDSAGGVGSDRGINIQHGDYPANSAGAMSFDYCTQGFSGQADKGGLIIGGSDPVCRQTRMIGAALPEIMRLRAKDDPRAAELDSLVTDTVFAMFEDEEDRRKADQSFNLFKAVGPWLLVILLF